MYDSETLEKVCREIAERQSSGEMFLERQNVMKLFHRKMITEETRDKLLAILTKDDN